MSDIVKRLRSVYAAGPTVGSMLDPIPDPLTNEAADEIERLRQQRDEYANEITGKLMPEIERLRVLLRKLYSATDEFWIADELLRRVREALGDAPDQRD